MADEGTVTNVAPVADAPAAAPAEAAPMTFENALTQWGNDTTPLAFDEEGNAKAAPSKELPMQDVGDEDDIDAVFDEEEPEEGVDDTATDSDDDDDEDSDEDEVAVTKQAKQEEDTEKTPETLSKEEYAKKVRVKVNGVKKDYTIEQLINIASSGMHTIQKHQEFEAHKAEQTRKIQDQQKVIKDIDAKISPAWEKVKAKDFLGAVSELAIQNGANKLEVQRELMVSILPKICQRLGLTPQEAKQRIEANVHVNRVLDIQEENEWLKEQAELAKKQTAPKASDDVELAKAQVLEIQQRHGLSNRELQDAYNWLCNPDNFEGGEKAVTAAKLEEVAVNRRICDKAVEAVLAVRPTYIKNDKFVDRVVAKLKENPEWGVSQLARWVDRKAQKLGERTKENEKASALKDISRKALKGSIQKDGKVQQSGFANPNTQAKKPLKFGDLTKEDSYQLP